MDSVVLTYHGHIIKFSSHILTFCHCPEIKGVTHFMSSNFNWSQLST